MEKNSIINEDCIFCNIILRKSKAAIIHENDKFICLMDKYPISEGHFLVISKNHYDNIFEMPLTKVEDLFKFAIKIGKTAKIVLNAKGINIGQNNGKVANQIVPHVHVHVIPRYDKISSKNNWPSRKLVKFEELSKISNLIKSKLVF